MYGYSEGTKSCLLDEHSEVPHFWVSTLMLTFACMRSSFREIQSSLLHFDDNTMQSETDYIHWNDLNELYMFKDMNNCLYKYILMAFYSCYWLVKLEELSGDGQSCNIWLSARLPDVIFISVYELLAQSVSISLFLKRTPTRASPL